ncbi:MAG: hypothetical protein ACI9C1_001580 [Candidatus Aldehydirespiratoraceae bacterium]|jgi:hypothetical protein
MVRNPRTRGERGATLLESALITPLLLLFVFGIFEFGFAFRDYLTVANATRDGAREASVAGNVADTDYRTLRSIKRAAAALPTDGLDLVVIFKASGPTETVPATCAAGTSVVDVCNVYTPSDFNLVEAEWGCQSTANTPPDPINSPDLSWCPKDRQVSTGSGLDYVGIYIQATHEYVTGLFGDRIVFEDQMILKVEPHD